MPDRTFIGYVGSCVDVSEVKEAHLAVLNSAALNEAMLESIHGRVAALDAGGVIIATNRAWTEAVAGVGALARTVVGDNYLAVCRSAGSGDAEGQRAAAAIEDVLARRATALPSNTGLRISSERAGSR